jgi:hypothetical protein
LERKLQTQLRALTFTPKRGTDEIPADFLRPASFATLRLAICCSRRVQTQESFRGLRVWQLSMQLVEEVYAATRAFPSDERFGLTAQLRRAGFPPNSIDRCNGESTKSGAC